MAKVHDQLDKRQFTRAVQLLNSVPLPKDPNEKGAVKQWRRNCSLVLGDQMHIIFAGDGKVIKEDKALSRAKLAALQTFRREKLRQAVKSVAAELNTNPTDGMKKIMAVNTERAVLLRGRVIDARAAAFEDYKASPTEVEADRAARAEPKRGRKNAAKNRTQAPTDHHISDIVDDDDNAPAENPIGLAQGSEAVARATAARNAAIASNAAKIGEFVPDPASALPLRVQRAKWRKSREAVPSTFVEPEIINKDVILRTTRYARAEDNSGFSRERTPRIDYRFSKHVRVYDLYDENDIGEFTYEKFLPEVLGLINKTLNVNNVRLYRNTNTMAITPQDAYVVDNNDVITIEPMLKGGARTCPRCYDGYVTAGQSTVDAAGNVVPYLVSCVCVDTQRDCECESFFYQPVLQTCAVCHPPPYDCGRGVGQKHIFLSMTFLEGHVQLHSQTVWRDDVLLSTVFHGGRNPRESREGSSHGEITEGDDMAAAPTANQKVKPYKSRSHDRDQKGTVQQLTNQIEGLTGENDALRELAKNSEEGSAASSAKHEKVKFAEYHTTNPPDYHENNYSLWVVQTPEGQEAYKSEKNAFIRAIQHSHREAPQAKTFLRVALRDLCPSWKTDFDMIANYRKNLRQLAFRILRVVIGAVFVKYFNKIWSLITAIIPVPAWLSSRPKTVLSAGACIAWLVYCSQTCKTVKLPECYPVVRLDRTITPLAEIREVAVGDNDTDVRKLSHHKLSCAGASCMVSVSWRSVLYLPRKFQCHRTTTPERWPQSTDDYNHTEEEYNGFHLRPPGNRTSQRLIVNGNHEDWFVSRRVNGCDIVDWAKWLEVRQATPDRGLALVPVQVARYNMTTIVNTPRHVDENVHFLATFEAYKDTMSLNAFAPMRMLASGNSSTGQM